MGTFLDMFPCRKHGVNNYEAGDKGKHEGKLAHTKMEECRELSKFSLMIITVNKFMHVHKMIFYSIWERIIFASNPIVLQYLNKGVMDYQILNVYITRSFRYFPTQERAKSPYNVQY